MNQPGGPNLGSDLARIHKVMTRGLEVAMQTIQDYRKNGVPDEATGNAFATYLQTLTWILHGHHTTEDEVAFPFFRERLPDIPVDLLLSEHMEMAARLEELAQAIVCLREGPCEYETFLLLNEEVTELQKLWLAHIAREESLISPQVCAQLFSLEQSVEMGRRFGQHSGQHSGPDYLAIPFILYNLTPDDRAVQAKMMPPQVIQELVPGPWREKWAPMKPFLFAE